uniref:Uncharacterized protein n=1 Tax=Panagrolaimus davidi TaxID=227884 RepID=A0A914QJ01_9BILA
MAAELPPDMKYQDEVIKEQEKEEDMSLAQNLIESVKEMKEDIKDATHNFVEDLKDGAISLKKTAKTVASHADEISHDIVNG